MNETGRFCATCQAPAVSRCTKCKSEYYCGREHQVADWKRHRSECKVIIEPASHNSAIKSQQLDIGAGQSQSESVSKTSQNVEEKSAQRATEDPTPISRKKVSGSGESIDAILSEHEVFEKKFTALKLTRGLDDDETLEAALDLIDSWIGLYHLEPTAALIDEIWTLCHSRGEGSRLQIKVLQARAFLRFKQHNFRDCLGDFLKFREIVGPSAELAENTGHAYNSLGQLRNAELSFTESLQLMDAPGAPPKASSNRGGVLLGLGLVKERQGDLRGGLDFIYQALGFYRNKFAAANGQHSLIAKSLMSVGKCHEKLRELDQAETAFREAVAVFQATCGNNTPLTADSMFCLAKVLYAQRTFPKYQEARTYLFTSLDNYTSFDSLHIYMNIIIEITMCAVKWGTTPAPPGDPDQPGDGNDPATGKPLKLVKLYRSFDYWKPPIEKCISRLEEQKIPKDGNLGVFFKSAGEIHLMSGAHSKAVGYFAMAVKLFKTVTDMDLSKLIAECESMSTFASNQR